MKRLCLILLLLVLASDANAFWWLLRGAAARGTGSAIARGAATTGAVAADEAAALSAVRSTGSAGRFCVRPINATACDFRAGTSAIRAAEDAVGSGYKVRPTNRPGLFEILDAAGKVVDFLEVIDKFSHDQAAPLQEYIPIPTADSIVIRNPVAREMYFRVSGGGGPWLDFAVPPNGWANVNGLRGVPFDVEITSQSPTTGQFVTVRQSIWPGRELIYIVDQGSGLWQLAER